MSFGRKRFQVRSDLVCDVAIRADAIGSHDHEVDLPLLHQVSAGIVGNDRVRHPMPAKLERRQRRTLIARPRLVDPDMHADAAIVRMIDG